MNVNLPANIADVSPEDIMRLTGQEAGQSGINLPSLRINYHEEDDDGNSLPKGHWVMSVDGVLVYAPEVLVRILFSTYQYGHYDNDLKKQVSTSVHFQNWSDDIPDDSGGFRCGKVSKTEYEKLSPADQAVQKDIKLSRVLFCLVDIDGVDFEGNPVSAESVPAVFYARGTNFMPIADYLKTLTRHKKLMQKVITKFKIEKHKNGTLTYFEVAPESGDEVDAITSHDIELIQEAAEAVKAENDGVIAKFEKARGGSKKKVDQSKDLLAKILDDDDDLNDELPPNLGG